MVNSEFDRFINYSKKKTEKKKQTQQESFGDPNQMEKMWHIVQ